jgi:hypothetical protein
MRRPKDIRGMYKVFYAGQLVGETSALSVRQAINNVRHNVMGETTSQYVDPEKWSAAEIGGNENVKNSGI